MPARTQTRRAEDKHMDRQTSADNTALGFRAPRILSPPGGRFTLPNGVHRSPDSGSGEELSFQQSRLPSSAPAGLGLTPAGMPSLFPHLQKAFFVPDTFLLPSRASDLHWAFLSCLSTGAIIYFSPLSRKHSFLPVTGSRMSPQMLCPMSKSPSGKREGFQDNSQKGKFITDSSQGSCCI